MALHIDCQLDVIKILIMLDLYLLLLKNYFGFAHDAFYKYSQGIVKDSRFTTLRASFNA